MWLARPQPTWLFGKRSPARPAFSFYLSGRWSLKNPRMETGTPALSQKAAGRLPRASGGSQARRHTRAVGGSARNRPAGLLLDQRLCDPDPKCCVHVWRSLGPSGWQRQTARFECSTGDSCIVLNISCGQNECSSHTCGMVCAASAASR